MEKKAIDFKIVVQAINPATAEMFNVRVKESLVDGWDVLSSYPMGLDTGGGTAGAGSVMMCVTLVRYGYFEPTKEEQ